MKLVLLVLCCPTLAFAILPHEGSGGNICLPKTQKNYRALDEIYYPSQVVNKNRDDSLGKSPIIQPSIDSAQFKNGRGDLASTLAGKKVLEKIREIKKLDSEFANELENLLYILKDVYILESDFLNHYGSETDPDGKCEELSLRASMISTFAGQSVVSKKLWNRLGFTSQQVVILHEALRLAQVSRFWFIASSDQDVYLLTMTIMSGNMKLLSSNRLYLNFKEMLPKTPTAKINERILSLKNEVVACLKKNDDLCAFNSTVTQSHFEYAKSKLIKRPDPLVLSRNILKLKVNPVFENIQDDYFYWMTR